MPIKNIFTILVFLFLTLCCFTAVVTAGQTIEITVAEKDHLSGICKRYLDDPNKWPDIAKLNSIKNPNIIQPGQKLTIPAELLRGTPITGTVSFLSGDVQARKNVDMPWVDLKLGDIVQEKSLIKTGPDGSVEITFLNGSLILLKPNTYVDIRAARDKAEIHYLTRIYLGIGRVITNIRKATGKENRIEIQTPTAVAVARGTEFRSRTDNHEISRFEVLEGSIGVTAAKYGTILASGEGTLVNKGKPPEPAKKLLKPPEISDHKNIYKNLPLHLRFLTNRQATSLRVTIARDKEMRDILIEQVIRTSEAFELSSVPDGVYYLQATSIDRSGLEGLPSEIVPIHVRVNPLPPFTQIPADKGEYGGKRLEMIWPKVRDASSYHLQISEDAGFNHVIEDMPALTSTTFTAKLPAFKKYYYRICSVADDGFEGGWSNVASFSLSPLPPAPSLEKPQIGKNELSFAWQHLGDGMSSRFQMASDDAFEKIIIDQTIDKPMVVVPKPEYSGTYYIRICSINKQKGFQGDYSPAQSIQIGSNPPFVFIGFFAALVFILL